MIVLLYIAAIVAANLSVAHFGPIVTPINAFFLIGLDLSLRDHLHEQWSGKYLFARMGALLLIAGAISYVVNPASGVIAVASMAAFLVSNALDTMVYHLMRRKAYLIRSNTSNVAGAAADSLVFPTIAFGGLMPEIVAMQFAAKVAGGALWAFIINRATRKSA